MRIEYVGNKPVKEDNVAGTGTVWLGNGDVQEVSDAAACSKLLANPLIWRAAEDDAQATNADATAPRKTTKKAAKAVPAEGDKKTDGDDAQATNADDAK